MTELRQYSREFKLEAIGLVPELHNFSAPAAG